ncbi:MAG: CHRD domain-containing protein [Gammaproteobacteria bacterium]
MSTSIRRHLFRGAIATIAFVLIPLVINPPMAQELMVDDDDSSLRDMLRRGPHFTATLTSDQTVPPVTTAEGLSGVATARLKWSRKGLKLAYSITTDMDLNAGFPQSKNISDDVTMIHLHNAPVGRMGQHVLNVYKMPAQDDDDLVLMPNKGIVRGAWDNFDTSVGLAPGPASEPLYGFLDELCAGDIYVNIHGFDSAARKPDTGALRGNLEPTRRGKRLCRYLFGKPDDGG